METNHPNQTPKPERPLAPAEAASAAPRRRSWTPAVIVVVLAVIIIAVIAWSLHPVRNAEKTSLQAVAVVKAELEDLAREVSIPAEFRAYNEVELHAKVSGYVDQIKVDFGDKVKAGQLLATLEVPELQDQLHNAIAMRQKAEADYTNSHVLSDRLQAVNRQHPNLVAQQDLDNALAKDGSAAAALAGAKAEVERYETLAKYTRITAPFDGIITRRYADPGTLIQAGTSSDTQARPVVRLSDNYRLRLDFPVSVDYVQYVRLGGTVRVRVDSLGGRTFTGTVARFTGRVNEDTRTMITEIELPNPGLELVPGMYAAVLLELERHPQALAIPIGAVGDTAHPTIYVVNGRHEIESRSVVLGLETPEKYEVLSGLSAGELVMVGSRSLVHPGQPVEIKLILPPPPRRIHQN